MRDDLSLQSLFEAPTVADMAMLITHRQVQQANQEDIARMLEKLEELSEDEAKRHLADHITANQERDRWG
jgi:hypothetical protein